MKTNSRLRLLVGLAIGLTFYLVPSARAQYAITNACQDAIFGHEIANAGLGLGCNPGAIAGSEGLSCVVAGANWLYSNYKLIRDCRTPPPPPPPPVPTPKMINPDYGYFDYYDPVDVISYRSQFNVWSSGCFVSTVGSQNGLLQN